MNKNYGLLKSLLLPVTGIRQVGLPKSGTGFYYPIGRRSWDHGGGGWLSQGPSGPDDHDPNKKYTEGYYHIGEDMLAPEGSSVYAISKGTVKKIYTTSSNADEDKRTWYIGPGNSVMFIEHTLSDDSKFLGMYMHIRPKVREGQEVNAGDEIATIGPWYNAPHLHFGIVPGTRWPASSMGRMRLPFNPRNTNGFVDPVDWLEHKTPKSDKPSTPKYTVEISVWPGLPLGNDATITFYGIEGYYRNGKVGRDNKLTLTDVPGGRGVKIRIDVDLKNKKHHEYYNQEIYGSNNRVSFTFKPT